MTPFDTILVVDWSAGRRAPEKPSRDAIWLGLTCAGIPQEPMYCRDRQQAEAAITDLIRTEMAQGRRLLAAFDFPFGYPGGFTRHVTGSDDTLALWDWFERHIIDTPDGSNNRFDVAETLNALFDGPGPFWGKSHKDRWPGVPYRKAGIKFDQIAEKRLCDTVSKAASSCFQMSFPPTVGGQIMMGLPVLARLRRLMGVRVWPLEDWTEAPVVLAEIWPGLIEQAVQTTLATLPPGAIRDREQVRLLANALSRLPPAELDGLMSDLPAAASEEAWILGAGQARRLSELALDAPPLRNDCFALPPGVHWTPVDEALALLQERLSPVTGTKRVALPDALGRIAAAQVSAQRANPPLPNTAVDGYGFAGGRGEGVQVLPLASDRAAAGDQPGILPEGHAMRVLTGAALPAGVDTVILQEDVDVVGHTIRFTGPIKTGSNTRTAGEDVRAGEVVIDRGRRVTPADLALLAATGVSDLMVHSGLRVGVLSTGDELVEPGAVAKDSQIFDANRPMLLGLVQQLGHAPVDLGQVPDDRAALRTRLDEACAKADVILTSGGASAGDEDHVSALLTDAGAMSLWRIAIKPGRPLALGVWQGVPVFGLPGNPVAAMICTLIFARPAMQLLGGGVWTVPQGFEVPAAFSKTKKAGRREYLRGRIRNGQAEAFASEGSGRISGLSWAEGLIELSEPAQTIVPGDMVRFIPYASFGSAGQTASDFPGNDI